MTSLKEARKSKGKMKQFIKEHEKQEKGDKKKFDKTLNSMTHPERKSK